MGENQCATSIEASNCLPQWSLLKLSLTKLRCTLENITECADPKDNKFLELAAIGKTDFIITGDADLLAMHPFRGIAIVTVESFLTTVGLNGSDRLKSKLAAQIGL